jgi:acylglycerol lipase
MGGLITASYIQNMVDKDFYPEKVFLSSPVVASGGAVGAIFANAPKFLFDGLKKAPSVRLEGMMDLKKLSHDGRVYEAYVKDELNHLKIHSKLYFEILKTSRDTFSRPLRAECPIFVSIGTEDVLVHPKYVINYFKTVEKSAQLKIVEGGYHELHNEIEKYRKPYFDFLRQALTGLSFE